MKHFFTSILMCLLIFSLSACTAEDTPVETLASSEASAITETPKPSELSAPTKTPEPTPESTPTINPNPVTIGIFREVPPSNWAQGKIDEIVEYADLRSADLSHLDLSDSYELLMNIDCFDDYTIWPENLPDGFDPDLFIETGLNPGLGVRALHEQGITGKGVSIGIIDQALYTSHPEYKDNLMYYEEMGFEGEYLEYFKKNAAASSIFGLEEDGNVPANMHGGAVSTIAVGKNGGVAPEANLYFIAANSAGPDGTYTYKYRIEAIDRFIEINEALPEDEKIKIVSMSLGINSGFEYYKEMLEAIFRAKDAGIFISTPSDIEMYSYNVFGAYRPAICDPDDPNVYSVGYLWKTRMPSYDPSLAYVPMDARAYASPFGDGYEYCLYGAASWKVPYSSGLFVLCQQVYPDITPDLFWQKLRGSADLIRASEPAIYLANPANLIEAFKELN